MAVGERDSRSAPRRRCHVTGWRRCVSGLALSLSLAVAVVVLVPAAALATFHGQDGVIAYAAPPEGIWALNLSNGYQLQVTAGPEDSAPSFSPSGDLLAFQRGRGAHAMVYVVQADGAAPRPLASGGEPTFSAHGSKIAFVRPGGLFETALAAGSPVRQLTRHAGDNDPTFSSTGALAFERVHVAHMRRGHASQRRVRSEVELIAHPGAPVRTLLSWLPTEAFGLSTGETDFHLDWSPSGKSLAVALCNASSPSRLPVPTHPAVRLSGDCGPTIWAPDGRGTIEPKQGSLVGAQDTSCPAFISAETEIAWQPVVGGTAAVATKKCEPRPGRIETSTEPAEAAPGSVICITYRHKRRCYKA